MAHLERLASQHEEERWDAHRSIANWVEEFSSFVTEQLPLHLKQERSEREEKTVDPDTPGSTPWMEMSPEIPDPD